MPSASSRVVERPGSAEAAAEALAAAAGDGRGVRIVGGGTKLERGYPAADPDLDLSTAGLDALVEHTEIHKFVTKL